MELSMPHKLTLSERSSLGISGVTEAVSFDDQEVVLKTTLGLLTVQGSGLQLKNLTLDGGQVAVEGHIDAISYEEPRQEAGLLRRLFR